MDGTPIKHDSNIMVIWKKEERNSSANIVELSMQFRVITEYAAPNYENIYPDDVTKYIESLQWETHFGESYFITITNDKTNGYKDILN